VQDALLNSGGQLGEGRFEREVERLGQGGQQLIVSASLNPAGLAPRSDRALSERQALIADHQIGVEVLYLAHARAGRAGALRIVEGEIARLERP